MKKALGVLVLLSATSGCNVCQRIYDANATANEKYKNCGTSNSTVVNVSTCSNGLTSCSQDDMKWLNTYADCLEKLPMCEAGQGFSWSMQRLGCIEPLGKVSGSCLNAIN